MSLLELLREKIDLANQRTTGRFRVELDEDAIQAPKNLEYHPLYSAYLFEPRSEREFAYPLFAIESKTAEAYPAELRIRPERDIAPIQINTSGDLISNLDTVLREDFLEEHVRVVPALVQFPKRK